MDMHSDYIESTKSILSFDNIDYYKNEDSGYHTSFTPGSLDRSEISNGFLDQSAVATTAFIEQIHADYVRSSNRYNQLKPRNDTCSETPPPRRGVKRTHSSVETTKQTTTIPTPTTLIAGKIQNLDVNEDKENTSLLIPSGSSHNSERNSRYICRLNVCDQKFPYPITPVKRNCRSNTCTKSSRKLDFVIHSISCDKHELQPASKQITHTKIGQPILARPDQKIDIIRLLNEKCAIPPLKNIFRCLSNEDICNFLSVSSTWNEIWNFNNNHEKKLEIKSLLKTVKENKENFTKDDKTYVRGTKFYEGCFKEFHNEINDNPVKNIPESPQYSPRTNRFRKFIKSASLDTRLQLSCVRCSEPAKVTKEATGEEWVECTNVVCSFHYCRSCNCSRHPGKSCARYDLNAPSPSKRKKCDYAVGARKSRKNLRRLL